MSARAVSIRRMTTVAVSEEKKAVVTVDGRTDGRTDGGTEGMRWVQCAIEEGGEEEGGGRGAR